MVYRTKRSMDEADVGGSDVETSEGTCRSCYDLGMKWPQWHTLTFEGQVQVDMRYVCPEDAKIMLMKQARSTFWREWAASMEN